MLYGIKQGLKNLRHNGIFSLASIGTVAACLFLFGIFYFVIVNFQNIVHKAERTVGVTVFFDEGISEQEIEGIGEMVRDRTEVAETNYVSEEEAWDKLKGEWLDNGVFENEEEIEEAFVGNNPLEGSASFEIFLNDVSRQGELVSFLEGVGGVRKVNRSDETAKNLSNINLLISYISMAIILILLAVAIFLICTTITTGISVRKEEIKIMKLLGATDYFIRMPFVVEGIVIGLVGACMPIAILYPLYQRMTSNIGDRFFLIKDFLIFMEPGEIFKTLVPLSLLVGVGMGLLGSYWAVKKHLFV